MRSHNPAPSLPLLAYGFLLTGLGTALLGPILPLLARQYHLSDAAIGLLPLTQFLGATLGGITVMARPQRSFAIGATAAALAFALFAVLPTLTGMVAVLFVAAWGVGQMIASSNVITGARYTHNRASALTLLNFIWSGGALLSPLLAAWLTPIYALRNILLGFAALFAVLAAIYLLETLTGSTQETSASATAEAAPATTLPVSAFLLFAAMLALYGSFEASINVWLTTFMLRYGGQSLSASQTVTSTFWLSLAISRGVSSAALLRINDSMLQRSTVALVALFTAALLAAHGTTIPLIAVLIGICLGPVFPVTFAMILGHKPTSRQAGIILASSGIGAAFLPWLMGVLSRQTGSLRLAFILPVASTLALLLCSFRLRSRAA